MSNNDPSQYTLRFNEITGALEYGSGNNWTSTGLISGAGVTSFNTLTGAVTISAGSNIALTPSGNNIAISSSGGGGSSPNVVSMVDTTGFSTTASSFQPTLSTVTITPSSNTAKIKVTAVGGIATGSPTASGVHATIFKDGVNVCSSELTLYFSTDTTLTSFNGVPCTMQWIETPGDTSPHTYTVAIKNEDGSTEVRWLNDGSTPTGVMIAEEIH